MLTISNSNRGAAAPRDTAATDAASSPPAGHLSSQRRIATQAAPKALINLGAPRPTTGGTPQTATLSGRKISKLRMITGCTLGAAIGAMLGGPIGIGVGVVVGSAYVLIGPHAMAQVIQKTALMAYQQIQHYRTSHQSVTNR